VESQADTGLTIRSKEIEASIPTDIALSDWIGSHGIPEEKTF
jgi:hypothetical protein